MKLLRSCLKLERTKSDLCKEYIWQIKMMMDLSDGGPFGLYGLEQHRIRLHESICDAFEIDHDKSKSVLSYFYLFFNLTHFYVALNNYKEFEHNYLTYYQLDLE